MNTPVSGGAVSDERTARALEVKQKLMKMARNTDGLKWSDRYAIGEAIAIIDSALAALTQPAVPVLASEPVAYLCTRPSGFAWPLMPKDMTPAVRETLEADHVVITPLAPVGEKP